MKRLALIALCLMGLISLSACVDYDSLVYPEKQFDPGSQ
jgi:hypothetical protein